MPLNNLDNLPSGSVGHTWADYWEIACLDDLDREFSGADLRDRIEDGQDVGEGMEYVEDANVGRAERDDALSARIADFARHLDYRNRAFRESYPFQVENDLIVLDDPLSPSQELYLFLVLAANLVYIQRFQDELTSAFEVLSAFLTTQLLPEQAEVHLFPARHGGRYTGNLESRIRALVRDLNERPAFREGEFSPHNVGDAGLDVVGWADPGDGAPGRVLIFGQCSCGDDWSDKQSSSSYDNWSSFVNLTAPPVNLACIPYCYRSVDGEWHQTYQISNAVLIDRLRFINLLPEHRLGELFGAEHQIESARRVPSLVRDVINQDSDLSDAA